MKYQFFKIPAIGGDEPAAELNRLIASTRTLTIDRNFVPNGENSFWALCVVTDEQVQPTTGSGKAKQIDYRDVLSPDDFAVFSRLREVRKQLALRDAVPPYSVLTNEQLAEIARTRPRAVTALQAIPRFGQARIEKYGSEILKTVENFKPSQNEGTTS